ncbi:MAG: hypothetical protein A2017_00375 [Lentisphaerae bacterium GWF2_44_16]|nr:MAG: hypothetical protein A2017_00375 [Lentisphaerae bacterium GWF2_44_16]
MLKLNASYSKKIPAESEYSSQSYHASVEIELSDGLQSDELKTKIHDTFNLVKNAVEDEIGSRDQKRPDQNRPGQNKRSQSQDNAAPASNKQIKYLLDLARQHNFDINAAIRRLRVENVYELTRLQCSGLIDEILGKQKAA